MTEADTTVNIYSNMTLESLNAEAITVDGNSGNNTVDLSGVEQGVTVDLGAGALNVTGGTTGMTITNFENVTGTAQADTITGDAGSNWIDGGAGADAINGGAGQDVVFFDKAGAGVTAHPKTRTGSGGGAERGNGNRLPQYRRSSMAFKAKVLSILTAVLIGTAQPALADWDGFGENRTWIIEGQVMSVTPDSFILLRPSGGVEDEIIKLHLWGLKVDPSVLRVRTVGRRFYCAVLYDTGAYLGVDCAIVFIGHIDDDPVHAVTSADQIATAIPIQFFIGIEIPGSRECSPDDIAFGVEVEDQSGLPIKCGRNNTTTNFEDAE